MHPIDAIQMHWEKVRCELLKNAAHCLKQILEITAHKTRVVWLVTSRLTNHSIKTNKLCEGTAREARTNS